MNLLKNIIKRRQEINDELARAKKALKWSAKIDRLASRKTNPKSEAEFCDDHKISASQFNRHKNARATPTQEIVDKVEAAFRAENV